MTTTTASVRPVDPAVDADVEAYHRAFAAAEDADRPDGMPLPREHTVGALRQPSEDLRREHRLVEHESEAVAAVRVDLPWHDNTSAALVAGGVVPWARRRGHGRALWAEVLRIATEHDRTTVIAESGEPWGAPDGPGSRFLAALGFEPALDDAMSVLDLGRLDAAALREQLGHDQRAAAAAGYALELWAGPPPEQEWAQVGRLEHAVVRDAPMGSLDYEPENWPAERVGRGWTALDRRGLRPLHAVARDRTGRVVAWTNLVVAPSVPTWADQWNTIVEPAHRGHRLGLLVKRANLVALLDREPQVTRVQTWNAVSNSFMLAINDTLGFRRVERWREWQLRLG